VRLRTGVEDEMTIEKMEITDIGSLVRALRKAAVDRVKCATSSQKAGRAILPQSMHVRDHGSLSLPNQQETALSRPSNPP